MLDAVASGFYRVLSLVHYSHPAHPISVHIPVGMVVGAFVLGTLGVVAHQPRFRRAAWYCLNVGLVFTIPTVATGLIDWRHSYAGALMLPFQAKFVLAALLLVLLGTGFFIGRKSSGETKAMVPIYTLGLLLVAGLGYFGGELVYGGRAPSSAQASQAGQELYASNCGGCHMNGGNQMNPGLPVKNSPKTSDLQTFISWLRAPRRPMPAFSETTLPDPQARELFDYIANVMNKS